MPWGLVSYGFRAKVAAAFWLPEVRLAAAVYWYTLSVPLSTIQMSLTFVGLIVSPVGWALAASIVQLPNDPPASVYLNTLC